MTHSLPALAARRRWGSIWRSGYRIFFSNIRDTLPFTTDLGFPWIEFDAAP